MMESVRVQKISIGPLDIWYQTPRAPVTGSKVPICMVTFVWESPEWKICLDRDAVCSYF
jgi:hypothetical protein